MTKLCFRTALATPGLLIIFNIAYRPSFHPPSSEDLFDLASPALPLLPLPEDDPLVQQHVGVQLLLPPGMAAGRSGAGHGGHGGHGGQEQVMEVT